MSRIEPDRSKYFDRIFWCVDRRQFKSIRRIARQPSPRHEDMQISATDFQGHQQIKSGSTVMRTVVEIHRPALIEFALDQHFTIFECLRILYRGIQNCWRRQRARAPLCFNSSLFRCAPQLPLAQRNAYRHHDDGCNKRNKAESKSDWHYNDGSLMRRCWSERKRDIYY